MENTLNIAVSRQMVLRRNLDAIANNVANADTTGYKAERMVFARWVEHLQPSKPAGDASFVIDRSTYHEFADGALTETRNPLDVALSGDGWFQVAGADGQPRYTRDGRFHRDPTGRLVTQSGLSVSADGGGEIVIPADARQVTITQDGTVSADGEALGRLGVVRIPNPQTMVKEGDGLYTAAMPAVPADRAQVSVQQGFIEHSNVKPIVEITRMMQATRDYEQAQKIIDGEDDRQRKLIERLGRAAQ